MVNDPEILLVPELLAKPSRRAVLASAGSGLILLGGTGFGFAQGAFGGYDDDRLYKDQDGNLYRKRGGQYVRYNGRVANGRPVPGSETPDGFGGRPAQEPDLDAEAYARRRAERYGEPPPASAAGPNPAGPSGPRQAGVQVPVQAPDNGPIDHATAYSALTNEPFPVAAINTKKLNPAFLRQEVAYTGAEPPGTIVVDPKAHQLYFVLPGGRARRYGVGVGKQGFAWAGAATINSKQAWPDWYPPKEMIERRPDLRSEVSKLQSGLGVPGGARNPLGARAMYLWQNNKDTLFRIHGTLEPYSIGQSVSSGCIRMINQDAIDLYNRVDVGTKVVVIGDGPPAFQAGPSGRAAARIASRR